MGSAGRGLSRWIEPKIRRMLGGILAAAVLAPGAPARADPAVDGSWSLLGTWPISATQLSIAQ
jgi:hypothetical protein